MHLNPSETLQVGLLLNCITARQMTQTIVIMMVIIIKKNNEQKTISTLLIHLVNGNKFPMKPH